MKTPRKATSWRLSPEAKRLLALLAAKAGVSMTALLEGVIRDQARRERIQ